MKLPKTTKKQQAILELLYTYRFLNRIQIQSLMGHKDYKRINAWMKDLREKYYVEWLYSTDFLEKTKPAIYYLGLNGIRYLKATGDYPPEELHKRYRDKDRAESFIDHCTLIGGCCAELKAKSSKRIAYY